MTVTVVEIDDGDFIPGQELIVYVDMFNSSGGEVNNPTFAVGDVKILKSGGYITTTNPAQIHVSGANSSRIVITALETADQSIIKLRYVDQTDPMEWAIVYVTATSKSTAIQGQGNFSYTDTVINEDTGLPIEDAIVQYTLPGSTEAIVQTTTDVTGQFILFANSSGPFDVIIYKSNFEIVTVPNVTFT